MRWRGQWHGCPALIGGLTIGSKPRASALRIHSETDPWTLPLMRKNDLFISLFSPSLTLQPETNQAWSFLESSYQTPSLCCPLYRRVWQESVVSKTGFTTPSWSWSKFWQTLSLWKRRRRSAPSADFASVCRRSIYGMNGLPLVEIKTANSELKFWNVYGAGIMYLYRCVGIRVGTIYIF